jgi:cytochrome oxidase assembly protein ShyY1
VYRFALTPRWILSHLFVLLVVVTMVNLGFWQLRRLEEKRDFNDLVAARMEADPVPVQELLPVDATDEQLAAAEYRQVSVVGTWRASDEVLINNRTNEGAPGFWVVTPVQLADGTAVAVNRGWVPVGVEGDPAAYAPSSEGASVTGLVRESQTRGRIGPTDPAEGTLDRLSRVDVERLDQQVDLELYPVYVDLLAQEPPQADGLPGSIGAPDLDEGPHLSYAGQWFIFATLTLIVYPLLLRRVARNKAAERAAAAARERDGGPGDPADPAEPPLVGSTS